MNRHPITLAAIVLALFAVAGSTLVSFTYIQTKERIDANEREALLKTINSLVPAATIDNDIVNDVLVVSDPAMLGGEQTTIYRGRKHGQPIAAVISSIVPNGYSGPIKLLVAVKYNNSLGGVRVLSHKETPGLGDKIEERRSDWVYSFNNRSIGNPPVDKWKVKKDGGIFDQFTGATVTPRSIVRAVKNTLLYTAANQDAIYDIINDSIKPQGGDANGK